MQYDLLLINCLINIPNGDNLIIIETIYVYFIDLLLISWITIPYEFISKLLIINFNYSSLLSP